MAEVALHRCVVREYDSEDKDSHQITKIHYSYEFLDDFITVKPSIASFVTDTFQWNHKNTHDRMIDATVFQSSEVLPMQSFSTVQAPDSIGDEKTNDNVIYECKDGHSWMQEKFNLANHPLELMVKIVYLTGSTY